MNELVTACCAIALALLAAIKLVRDPGASGWELSGGIIAAAIIFVMNLLKAIRTRKDELRHDPIKSPDEMVGWTKGLHSQLCSLKGCDADGLRLRLTVYKVHWDKTLTNPTELEQIVPYVGGEGGPVGRRMSMRSGVAGRSARVADIVDSVRGQQGIEEFRYELVEQWGFTREEARQISTDRWAWMAVPLLQPKNDLVAFGVVYLDAADVAFFSDEDCRDAILSHCASLASILAALYDKK